MKIIDPSVKMITEHNPFKKIELIGRTCYKSEDMITNDSARKFVDGLIKRKHFAMLEHAEVTYVVTGFHDLEIYFTGIPFIRNSCILDSAIQPDTYVVTVSLSHLFNPIWEDNLIIAAFKQLFINYMEYHQISCDIPMGEDGVKITIIPDLVKELPALAKLLRVSQKDIWNYHGSYTFKFICDRGVSHELVRHRCSFAQESTRYCNYSSEKFGREIQFIRPSTFDEWDNKAQEEFVHQLKCAESSYLYLSDLGLSPQQARAVLPNALKTEVIMTAPVYQWRHFFNLRSIGTTGKPHPDMKAVADPAYKAFKMSEATIGLSSVVY